MDGQILRYCLGLEGHKPCRDAWTCYYRANEHSGLDLVWDYMVGEGVYFIYLTMYIHLGIECMGQTNGVLL